MAKQSAIEQDGVIVEALSNAMFLVNNIQTAIASNDLTFWRAFL